MNRNDTLYRLPKELDHRENDGIEVWLLWSKAENRVFVLVHDTGLDHWFELDVEEGDGLEVFHHPFAYAASRGVEYRTAQRAA